LKITQYISQKGNSEFFRSQLSIRTMSVGITVDGFMANILTFSHRDLNAYSPPSCTTFFSLGI